MSGRPAGTAPVPQIRTEVLKELQQILENRDQRDRLDRGPLAETKGREHWVLHLLLRAQESTTQHFDVLVGSAYSNLAARLQALDDRVARIEDATAAVEQTLATRFESAESAVGGRVSKELADGVERAAKQLSGELGANLDSKWKPIGESIEMFAKDSKQLTKDFADIYRVSTQTRLLLNENARRTTDLGRDLVALEESLRLAIQRAIEESLEPLEQRVAALEGRGGESTASTTDPPASGDSDGAPDA